MNDDEQGALALKDLLDGPVGPTGHLGPAARRIADRRRVRRRAGLTGAAAVAAAAAVAVPALLPSTEALAPGFAGPGGGPVDASATARALGMDGAFGQDHGAIAADCVRAAGIDYSPRQDPTEPAAVPGAYSLWLAPGGGGYGFADRAASGSSETPPAGWEAAMYGEPRQEVVIEIERGGSVSVPVGGCHGQATETLYGVPAETFERIYQQVRPLPDEVIRSATQDREVQDASDRWSECLAAAGWDVETPDGLDNALAPELAAADSGQAARDELARREAALRDADVRCRDKSGLQAAFDRAFAERGAQTAAAHGDALRAYRRMLDHAAAVTAERRQS